MNLLCPSCQNHLSVPEQYAGQLMKCPLCNNNFTVPALPQTAPEPSIALLPEPEPEVHEFTPIDLSGHTSPPAVPPPGHVPTDDEHGLYGLTTEPTPPAPPAVQRVQTAPPPSVPASAPAPVKKAPPPPRPPTPGGYTHRLAIALNPQILPWVAPVSLVLVFVLSFFPWVGRYYGSYGVVTQSGWGAAFGGYTVDDVFDYKTHWDSNTLAEDKPGVDVLMIFFLFLGLLPAVLIGVVAAALPWLKRQFRLPPGLAALEPWRWLLLTGATLMALLFLFLQIVTSFSIESRTRAAIERAAKKEGLGSTSGESKWIDIEKERAITASGLQRTVYLRLSLLLLIVAAAAAALTHWLEHRGSNRPAPRFELLW
jgi:hypothetical protein